MPGRDGDEEEEERRREGGVMGFTDSRASESEDEMFLVGGWDWVE